MEVSLTLEAFRAATPSGTTIQPVLEIDTLLCTIAASAKIR